LRLKNVDREELVARALPFKELAHEAGAKLVVNDDVYAALEAGADGVHLGRDDEGAERAVAGGLMLGLSAATVDEAVIAERRGAAYVGAGPIWPTPSKPDADPAMGLEGLRAICDAASIPVVAIGGIDATNAGDCIRRGAAGVAVIRAATDAANLRRVIDEALAGR
jgi:thiamine-phosphate pyrophosphorylase